jgi:ribonuclease PH
VTPLKRSESRASDQFRPIRFQRGFTRTSPGSVLVEVGRTQVLCTVTMTDQVPMWLKGTGSAWLSAEYSMLPGSTQERKPRDARTGRIDGRSQEIQRLIGRSLRSIIDLALLPECTLWVDCDVLSADGGTRTAAINGACVALYDAMLDFEQRKMVRKWPLRGLVSAMSVGVVAGAELVDLDYAEDSRADVDLNVVCLEDGRFVEVQGTGERTPFDEQQFQSLVRVGRQACLQVQELQRKAIGI